LLNRPRHVNAGDVCVHRSTLYGKSWNRRERKFSYKCPSFLTLLFNPLRYFLLPSLSPDNSVSNLFPVSPFLFPLLSPLSLTIPLTFSGLANTILSSCSPLLVILFSSFQFPFLLLLTIFSSREIISSRQTSVDVSVTTKYIERNLR